MENSINNLSVREIRSDDIPHLTDYWLNSDANFLRGMGVDLSKMPSREQWVAMLSEQLPADYPEKKTYCLIWLQNEKPIGHSNINKIVYGEEAFMHLHIWNFPERKNGIGTDLIKLSLPYYFKNFRLKKLFCEPYALNPAPNKTLAKLGFTFVKDYTCIPGWICFEQKVNLWELSLENFQSLSLRT